MRKTDEGTERVTGKRENDRGQVRLTGDEGDREEMRKTDRGKGRQIGEEGD